VVVARGEALRGKKSRNGKTKTREKGDEKRLPKEMSKTGGKKKEKTKICIGVKGGRGKPPKSYKKMT